LCRRSRTLSAIGSYGVIHGAATAASAITAMTAAPTSTILRPKSLRRRVAVGPRDDGASSRGTARVAISISPLVFHPRIDAEIQEIDRQVDQHIKAGNDEQCALNDWIIAAQHRGYHQVAHARQAEHGLRYDRAADQQCKRETDHRDHRDQRI